MRGFDPGLEALEGSNGELWNEISGEVVAGETFETGEAYEATAGERAFDEVQEMELAGALLEVATEEEMDRFLGNLIRRAGRAVGAVVRSPVGQALGGILKNAARQALPVVGGAIGSAIGGPSGGTAGSQIATTAGQMFGLELEGLSQEDQEYEAARRFVRFAGAAAANAAGTPATASPVAAAQTAVSAAARRHAPGLLRGRRRAPIMPSRVPIDADGAPIDASGWQPRHGRWVRRGRQVIIFNCNTPNRVETP
jgi:uncharacterized protein (DUF697 family)